MVSAADAAFVIASVATTPPLRVTRVNRTTAAWLTRPSASPARKNPPVRRRVRARLSARARLRTLPRRYRRAALGRALPGSGLRGCTGACANVARRGPRSAYVGGGSSPCARRRPNIGVRAKAEASRSLVVAHGAAARTRGVPWNPNCCPSHHVSQIPRPGAGARRWCTALVPGC